MNWHSTANMHPLQFICGYCDNKVASNVGYFSQGGSGQALAYIYICPNCTKPTYAHSGNLVPSAAPGGHVAHLPKDIEALYSEARKATAAGAHTAAVLACRKLLMNIAVAQGAAPSGTFVSYVEYLASSGYVPPNGKGWVDHIRRKGNEATHEIALMSATDSAELIAFAEMLLKFVFEFPAKVPLAPPAP